MSLTMSLSTKSSCMIYVRYDREIRYGNEAGFHYQHAVTMEVSNYFFSSFITNVFKYMISSQTCEVLRYT